MKTLFKALSVALVMSIVVLPVYPETSSSKPKELARGHSATVVQEKMLEVAVPNRALVWLQGGASKGGRLTQFNPQTLTISVGDVFQSIPIEQIKQIEFPGDVLISVRLCRTGISGRRTCRRLRGRRRRIRASEITTQGQKIWPGVPLTAFQLQSPRKAMLSLRGVISNRQLTELLSISEDRIYVVKKIQFESPGKMKISAVPVDRPETR